MSYIAKALQIMRDLSAFSGAMERVTREWPASAAAALIGSAGNRRAWLGAAAVCVSVGAPEQATCQAWWKLTPEQRAAANSAADMTLGRFLRAHATDGLPLFDWGRR